MTKKIIFFIAVFMISQLNIANTIQENYDSGDIDYTKDFEEEKEPIYMKTIDGETPFIKNGEIYIKINEIDILFSGECIFYRDKDKIIEKIQFKNGKKDGIYRRYSEYGSVILKLNYSNDKIDGISEKYYENGQLSVRTNYKAGKKDGDSVKYYHNHQIAIREKYKDGEMLTKELYR
jgi:antitoxin component YwqK of YwqJK toxin-antitoxin module